MANNTQGQHMVDAGLGGISAVVSSLPLGYNLGHVRFDTSGNKYKLVYNAGNSQASTGFVVTAQAGSVGPHSVTVSTVSQKHGHLGAGLVVHATLTTGTYGWALLSGANVSVVGDVSSIPTGSAFYIGTDGKVELMPQSLATGNTVIGVNLGGSASKTVTTGTKSGDCLIQIA